MSPQLGATLRCRKNVASSLGTLNNYGDIFRNWMLENDGLLFKRDLCSFLKILEQLTWERKIRI
jgi:hypothetical protein